MRADPLAYLGTELDSLKQQGLYRRLRILEDEQKPKTTFDSRQVVNLSSNNYLGLTTHPRLREAALDATRRLGVGSGSVRTIAGTMEIHMELERRLAAFKKVEAVVVFQSGFTANAGTVSAVLTKDDVVVSDELNHASIIDGSRLSRATIKVFPHKDAAVARKVLESLPASQRKLLITDGVFSMDGDLGGYVAGSKMLIEYLYHRARPFLFSTSHPPAVAAACIAALDVLESEPQIIDRLWENTRFFKAGLKTLGFNTGLSESPITPVIVGEGSLAMKLSDRLFQEGVFAQGIAFPTVARDKARVRTIVTATHTRNELQFALDTFGKVGRELGILGRLKSEV